MDYVIFGQYFSPEVDQSEGLRRRADRFGIAHTTYKKIRDPIGIGMRLGMDAWISELHWHFSNLMLHQKVTHLFLDVGLAV